MGRLFTALTVMDWSVNEEACARRSPRVHSSLQRPIYARWVWAPDSQSDRSITCDLGAGAMLIVIATAIVAVAIAALVSRVPGGYRPGCD